MKGLACFAAALCLCAFAASPYQKGKPRGDVQILEAKARRSEDNVTVDGRVRAIAEKPVHGLVLAFDFLSNQGEVLTSEKEQISDDAFSPGDELPFHAETLNPPGAIRLRIRAFDNNDKELRVASAGPYIID